MYEGLTKSFFGHDLAKSLENCNVSGHPLVAGVGPFASLIIVGDVGFGLPSPLLGCIPRT